MVGNTNSVFPENGAHIETVAGTFGTDIGAYYMNENGVAASLPMSPQQETVLVQKNSILVCNSYPRTRFSVSDGAEELYVTSNANGVYLTLKVTGDFEVFLA